MMIKDLADDGDRLFFVKEPFQNPGPILRRAGSVEFLSISLFHQRPLDFVDIHTLNIADYI
jgi:hypothetical protein